MRRLLVVLAFGAVAHADDFVLALEVETPPKLDLPSHPSFDSEQGVLHFSEVRALRPKTPVEVKGFVVWVYDCVTAISKPRDSRRLTLQRIEDTPSLCKEPHFALGPTPNATPSKSLWVVGVPRPLTKRERMTLPMEVIRDWPKVPKLEVGDFVVVEGTLNKDAKLAYAAVETNPKLGAMVSAPARPVVQKPLIAKRVATDKMLARTGLGENWDQARQRFQGLSRAAEGDPMFHLGYGQALYEDAIVKARSALAIGTSQDVDIDLSKIDFGAALVQLTYAVEFEPRLWRAHDYIGRIHRNRGDFKWAAESFDAAIRNGAPEPAPWVAYIALLREWRYVDQAIAVAKAATKVVPTADTYYELGMALDDKGRDDGAIAAFTKAVELRHDEARYRRGLIYWRKRQFEKGKADLRQFALSTKDDVAKQHAHRLLDELAGINK